MKKYIAILLLFALLLGGCTKAAEPQAEPQPVADMFTDRDRQTGYENAVAIELKGDSIACESKAVQVEGAKAIITGEGTYLLSGTLTDGMIAVNAGKKDKIHLVLKGASVYNQTGAALYIVQADKVFVTLEAGTENTLSNGGSFEAIDDNNIDGAVFSKEDLTFNGSGSLTVTSPAGHGIVAKDDLVFTGGSYTIESAAHGLDANDSVRIAAGTLAITAGKDGIHAENNDDSEKGFVYMESGTLDINAQGDGISAGAYLQILGGDFNIVTGGGSANAQKKTSDSWGSFPGGPGEGGGGRPGMGNKPSFRPTAATADTDSSTSIKGLKAGGDLTISGGTFTIDSADDAVHSNSSITVSGGSFTLKTGDDGFHADDTLTVTAGTILIEECYEGLEALTLLIQGGDITLTADDDGLNAAGGTDESGFGGFRGDEQFGGRGGGPGGGGFPGGGASNGSIVISGGNISITAYGDGIDANGTLEITGGHITVCGPTQGDTSTLDYDVSGTISGGTFIGTGAANMAQSFSASEQGVVAVNAGNQAAGTEIILKDAAGNTLISHTPDLSFQVIILSSPALTKGGTYTLTVGSSTNQVTAS